MFRGFPFLRVGAAASEFQVGRQVGFQAPEASSDLGLSATLLLFNHEVMSDSVTPWTAALLALLSSPIYWSLLTFVSIELVMLSNHLFLCCPLLLLPSIFPRIRVFSLIHNQYYKYKQTTQDFIKHHSSQMLNAYHTSFFSGKLTNLAKLYIVPFYR